MSTSFQAFQIALSKGDWSVLDRPAAALELDIIEYPRPDEWFAALAIGMAVLKQEARRGAAPYRVRSEYVSPAHALCASRRYNLRIELKEMAATPEMWATFEKLSRTLDALLRAAGVKDPMPYESKVDA